MSHSQHPIGWLGLLDLYCPHPRALPQPSPLAAKGYLEGSSEASVERCWTNHLELRPTLRELAKRQTAPADKGCAANLLVCSPLSTNRRLLNHLRHHWHQKLGPRIIQVRVPNGQ